MTNTIVIRLDPEDYKIVPIRPWRTASRYRLALAWQNWQELQEAAWRAVNEHHKRNDEIVMLCVQVDDECWRGIVDLIMPDYDWENPKRAKVVQGAVAWELCEKVAKVLPSISTLVTEKPAPGQFKLLVLAEGGCTVLKIEPKPLDDKQYG